MLRIHDSALLKEIASYLFEILRNCRCSILFLFSLSDFKEYVDKKDYKQKYYPFRLKDKIRKIVVLTALTGVFDSRLNFLNSSRVWF